MHHHDPAPTENLILSVLGGAPIGAAASLAGMPPARLAAAVERYRTAGRAALHDSSEEWFQANIRFVDYPTAPEAFRAYLLPQLRQEAVGCWWFIRKHPHWRLRIQPAPDTSMADLVTETARSLDSAVSWHVVSQWRPTRYEPETIAFGGPAGMTITHRLFHADSLGVIAYDQLAGAEPNSLLEAKATSLLVLTSLLRAAGLEWGEQGDVWGQVEAKRVLPSDVPTEKISALADTMRQLLTLDTAPLLTDGPLSPLRDWVTGMERGGQALKNAAQNNNLLLGLRAVLARHVLFHWNRMGFTVQQQAIWSRAAREAILGE
ncbi:hypothetical protein GCM10010423_69740 [Streptomyces levis]|uniref:Thiopeptide-type bacteriocin biosynthesis domain-containing protein n=1 Tax=Streptomyces levis TaxID=285566 RepID=A0ABN3P254_9ACTN